MSQHQPIPTCIPSRAASVAGIERRHPIRSTNTPPLPQTKIADSMEEFHQMMAVWVIDYGDNPEQAGSPPVL
jgi:hypothetical protein